MSLLHSPVAALNEYELLHLAAHLVAAQRDDDLHCLLTLETDQGRNAWYEAKESIDDAPGYWADVDLAWQQAEVAWDIARQVQYALCQSSLASVAADCSPELLALAVECECLTPRQALAVVQRMPDRTETVDALAMLVPYLSGPLWVEGISAAESIDDEELRARVLIRLIPHLPQALQTQAHAGAIAAMHSMIDKAARVGLDLPFSQIENEALRKAQEGGSRSQQAQALLGTLQGSEERRMETLETRLWRMRSEFWDEPGLPVTLLHLIRYLPRPLQRWILEYALEATEASEDNKHSQALALAGLIPYLSGDPQAETMRRALLAIQEIEDQSTQAAFVWMFPALIPCLSETVCVEAVQAMLALAQRIGDHGARERVLEGLAPYLSLGSQQKASELAMAADTSQGEGAGVIDGRNRRLSDSAMRQSESWHEEALELFRESGAAWEMENLLCALAADPPAGLEVQALEECLLSSLEWRKWDPKAANRPPSQKGTPSALFSLATLLSDLSRGQREGAYYLWRMALHQVGTYPRRTFLYSLHELTPFALAFAENQTTLAAEMSHAVQVVTRWWP